MGTLGGWLSDGIALRVGWAIVHSLWQGAAAALLLALALHALRRRGAQVRYVAACAALAAMVVAAVITAALVSPQQTARTTAPVAPRPAAELPAPSSAEAAAIAAPFDDVAPTGTAAPMAPQPHAAVAPARVASLPNEPAPAPWYRHAVRAIEPALPALSVLWLAGVAAMSLWHVLGWIHLHRTKRRGSCPASRSLQETCRRLARRLRVSRPVRLLESAVVAAPVVIGWLRPVILLPVAAVAGLTPAQLEAVLAHELAHIRRYDCLVRLVMAVVETLLFYHPAVWWVSSRVRDEAEHCCDEAAVTLCGNRRVYATALARAAELGRRAGPRLAAAADGGRLLPRIRRILGVKGTEPGRTRTWVAGLLVLAVLAVAGIIVRSAVSDGELEGDNTGPARFLAVRPNCDDDLFDADGKRIGTMRCMMHRSVPWNDGNQPRDFIFELPAGDEPVTLVSIDVEPAGSGHGPNYAMLADVRIERLADGRRVAVGSAELPSSYHGMMFRHDLDAVDVWLTYYHGPRGEPDAVFSGPFAADGSQRQDDDGKGYTVSNGRKDDHSGASAVVSLGRGLPRATFPPCIAYDLDGNWHLGVRGGGAFSPETTRLTYHFPGLPLERIARLTFNEKPLRATARNVTVRWPGVTERTYPAYLDAIAARLGRTDGLHNSGLKSPEDAMKCIDLVCGYMAQTATRTITQGQAKPEDFPPEQRAAAHEAARAWLVSEIPELRAPAMILGLWGKWPEFAGPAIDLMANETTSNWRSEVGYALQKYAANLTDAEIERLGELVLAREDHYVQEYLGRRILGHARGPAAEAALVKLAHSPKTWCWRLGIQGLRYLDPDHKYEAVGRLAGESPELAAKVALTAGDILGRSDYTRERQRGAAMAAEMLTPGLWRVDEGSWHSLLRVIEAETDAATATNTMIGFLERLVDEWDLTKITGRANTNYIAVSQCVVRLNRLNGANLGNLGPQDGQHSSYEQLHDWRTLAAAAVRWRKIGADPSLLPTGWVPQAGDVRLVWLNKNDREKSQVALWSPGDAAAAEVYIPLLCERTGKPLAESQRNTDFVSWRLEQAPAGGGPRTLHARAGVIGRHSRTYAEPLADGSRPQRVLTSESPEWLDEWEVWVEPAGAADGKLTDTKLFESWKARYLAGPLPTPLPCVVSGPVAATGPAPAAIQTERDDKQARARLIAALAMARAIDVQLQAADKALREGNKETAATVVRDALKQEDDFRRLVAGTLAETPGNLVIDRARGLSKTMFFSNAETEQKGVRQHMDTVLAQGKATIELLEGLVAGGLVDLPPAAEGGAHGGAAATAEAVAKDAEQADEPEVYVKLDKDPASGKIVVNDMLVDNDEALRKQLGVFIDELRRSGKDPAHVKMIVRAGQDVPHDVVARAMVVLSQLGVKEWWGGAQPDGVGKDAALEKATGQILNAADGEAQPVAEGGAQGAADVAPDAAADEAAKVAAQAARAAAEDAAKVAAEAAKARTRERMARKGIHDGVAWGLQLQLTDTTRGNVLWFLTEVAKQKPREITILVDRNGIEADGVDLDATVTVDAANLSLEEALAMALHPDLSYAVLDNGSLLVSTPAGLKRWQQPVMAEGPAESAAVARTRERLTRRGVHDGVDWSMAINATHTSLENLLGYLRVRARAKPHEVALNVDSEDLKADGVDLQQTLNVDIANVSLHEALRAALGPELGYMILKDGSLLVSTPARLAERAGAADDTGKVTARCRDGDLVLSFEGQGDEIVAGDIVTVRAGQAAATARGTRYSFETDEMTVTVQPRRATITIGSRRAVVDADPSRTQVRVAIDGQPPQLVADCVTVSLPSLKVAIPDREAAARTRERMARKGMHDGVDWSINLSLNDVMRDMALKYLSEAAKAKPREIKMVIDAEFLQWADAGYMEVLTVQGGGLSLDEALTKVLGDRLAYTVTDTGEVVVSTPSRLPFRAEDLFILPKTGTEEPRTVRIAATCRDGALVLTDEDGDELVAGPQGVVARSGEGREVLRAACLTIPRSDMKITVEPRRMTVVLPQETVPLDAGDVRFTAPGGRRTITPGEGRLTINERTVVLELDESRAHVRMSINGQKPTVEASSVTVKLPSLKVVAAGNEEPPATPTPEPPDGDSAPPRPARGGGEDGANRSAP